MSVHIMHSGLAAGWSGAITFWIQQYGDKVVMEYHLSSQFSLELVIRYKAFHQSLLDL